MTLEQERIQRIQTNCLLILSALGVAGALYFFRAVFIPFVLAVFLTYCLGPLIRFQMRKFGFAHGVAVVTTGLLGVLGLVLLGGLVAGAVGEWQANAEAFEKRLNTLQEYAAETSWLAWAVPEDGQLGDTAAAAAKGMLARLATDLMGVVSNGVLVAIFMIFLLLGQADPHRPRSETLAEIERQTQNYILAMTGVSIVLGLLVWLTLWGLGVQMALLFGFVAFLLNFIPNVGPIIATLVPGPVILIDENLSVTIKVLAFVIPGALQFFIGNYIQPRITGKSVDLHPIVVLLTLIFFGQIWGIIGMLLATPITAVLRMLLERIEYTRPIAEVLAGRIGSAGGSNQNATHG